MLKTIFGHARRFVLLSLVTAVLLLATRWAWAEEPTDSAEIADLRRRVQDLDASIRQLQAARPANAAGTNNVQSLPATATDGSIQTAIPPTLGQQDGGPGGVSSSVPPRPTEREGMHTGGFPLAGWNEGFYLRAPDGSYELHITGQLQTDFRGFVDKVDTATSPDEFLIRRARLGIEATVLQYYEVRLLPDFAGTTVSKSITDAYVNVHYWDAFQVEAGKFKQPFSYEELIQDRYVPTMERSMIDQMTPQRDEGVMIHGRKLADDRIDYAFAVSNGEQNDSSLDTNNHKDMNARAVFRPFNSPNGDYVLKNVQFGMSAGIGVENESISPSVITTPATVEWFAYNSTVVANGVRYRLSPELVYFYHQLGFAAQYFQEDQQIAVSAGKPAVNVPTRGYYIMGTYLLTGEHRYDYTQQIDPIHPFSPNCPLCEPGAWELVGRVEKLEVGQEAYIDHLATAGVSSLECTETTCGFNWYLNKWVRAQFNWEHAWFQEPIKIGNEPKPLSREDALYTRLQLIF